MEIAAGKKLIVHTTEGQQYGGHPVYTAVLDELRRAGIWTAVATRATAGFGGKGRLSTTMLEALACDLPVVVEATDTAERIDAVLPAVVAVVGDGLVELRDVAMARRGAESSE